MKTLNFEKINDIFNEFALTSDEMICVKGGNAGEHIILPNPPQIKI